MKKEFQGITGYRIEVNDDNLYIKSSICKENCYLPHIEWLKLNEVNFQGRGDLHVYTDVNGRMAIVFKRNQYDGAKEMYEFLLPYMERLVFNDDDEKLTIYNKGNDDPLEKPINKVNVSNPRTFLNYKDILSYEIICDDYTINNEAMLYTAAGKYVAGGTGALFEILSMLNNGIYINNLQIKLNINNTDNPCVYVNYITRKQQKQSEMARDLINMCERDAARLQIMLNKYITKEDIPVDNESETIKSSKDPYEEVKKLKELLDMGIVTQEEFDKKKKELLNL